MSLQPSKHILFKENSNIFKETLGVPSASVLSNLFSIMNMTGKINQSNTRTK